MDNKRDRLAEHTSLGGELHQAINQEDHICSINNRQVDICNAALRYTLDKLWLSLAVLFHLMDEASVSNRPKMHPPSSLVYCTLCRLMLFPNAFLSFMYFFCLFFFVQFFPLTSSSQQVHLLQLPLVDCTNCSKRSLQFSCILCIHCTINKLSYNTAKIQLCQYSNEQT